MCAQNDGDANGIPRIDAASRSASSESGAGGLSGTSISTGGLSGKNGSTKGTGSVSASKDATAGRPRAALDAGSDAALEAGPAACPAGYADCNGNPDDGCEVDLTGDPANCGACHHGCAKNNAAAVTCNAGRCEPTCSPGYADCNAAAATPSNDACETDLNANTTCGGCDHDCQGGECSDQRCRPVTLASGLTAPDGLAVDDKYVHWSDQTGSAPRVMRATLSGGNPTLVASDLPISVDNPLVSNGDYVVWATQSTSSSSSPPNGAIKRVHSGGDDVTAIVSNISSVTVRMDAAHVYWSDNGVGTLHEVALDGTMPHGIANAGAHVFAMAVDSTNLYFAQAKLALGLVKLSSGATVEVTPTTPGIDPMRLAADANNLYVWGAKTSSTEASDLLRMPKSLQGSPAVIATQLPTNSLGLAIAADATFVYFAGNDGLYRLPSNGGTAVRLATTMSPPAQIVATGEAVYWLDAGTGNDDGVLKKLAVFSN